VISYNPKEWFSYIFRFHKADTFRELLPMIAAIVLYSILISWIELEVLQLADDHRLKNLTIMHSMLSFVISMLLVFRTNTAYERWWEGRKLWGALVNNCRNLALKLQAVLTDPQQRNNLAVLISAYPYLLKNHLRELPQNDFPEADKLPQAEQLNAAAHRPNELAGVLMREVRRLEKEGDLTAADMWLINEELTALTDICGACERIKNTPIPFSYSVFLKKFIFFFIMTLPIALVFTLSYWCVPITAFIFYVLTSLELIAEEIEDPFGCDENDLPLDRISANIRQSVRDILRSH